MDKVCKRCNMLFLPVIRHVKYCINCQFIRKNPNKIIPLPKITNIFEDKVKYGYMVRRRYSWLKKSAKKRDLEFELSINWLDKLMKDNCYYCRASEYAFSVDRKDNQLGYSDQNCVTACRSCNSKKWMRDVDTFMTYYFEI